MKCSKMGRNLPKLYSLNLREFLSFHEMKILYFMKGNEISKSGNEMNRAHRRGILFNSNDEIDDNQN